MRLSALLSVLAFSCSVFSKPTEFKRHAGAVDVRGVPIKHNHRSHAHATRGDRSANTAGKLKKRSGKKNKRCVAKSTSSSAAPSKTSHAATSTKSSSHATTTAASSGSGSGSSGGSSGGVVQITDKTCGSNDPSATPGMGTGPNGKQDWFNCGLNDGGWTPPMITLDQLVFVPLADALKMKDNQFGPCEPLLSIFQEVAASTGVPDIMLASIAMQESTCSPTAYSAGSTGLFQLSSDLCKPYSDCYDPKSNTEGGANYIKTLLSQFNNNIAESMGNYNGWYRGIKPSDVQNMPCAERQNWNYLQNVFNGFMQGVDGNSNGNVNDGCQGADSD